MAHRNQRESLLLGSVFGAVVGFFAVLTLGLLPIFHDGTDNDGSDTSGTTTLTATADAASATPGNGRGGPPEGRGPGAGVENLDPLAFGTAEQEVIDAFTVGGCVACHSIKGVGGAGAIVGPQLFRTGVLAATRRPGDSAAAYIEESILNPDAFIMPNCPTGACPSGVMPKNLGEILNDGQLATIVTYLSALGTATEADFLRQ